MKKNNELQNFLNETHKVVIRFVDEEGEAYDGTELQMNNAEVIGCYLYPKRHGYADFHLDRFENDAWYVSAETLEK